MSTSNNDQFADWYRSANLNISSDIQTNRIKGITTLISNDEKPFWLDILRLYLGLIPIADTNRELFIKAFKDADVVFSIKGNENELKTLAGIAICYKIDKNTFLSDTISQALICAVFLQQYTLNSDIPVLERALKQIKKEAINERATTLTTDANEIKEMITELEETPAVFTIEQSLTIAETLKQSISAYTAQAEELNVLWWVFGGNCEALDVSYKEIESAIVPIYAAHDLYRLNEFSLGLVRSKPILQKLIASVAQKASAKKLSPFDLINSLSIDARKFFCKELTELSEFTPCLTALKQSLNYENGLDWAVSIKRFIGDGNIKKEYTPVELSEQFYKEFVLLAR